MDLRNDEVQVCLVILSPTLIKDNIFDSVLRSEVDVVLVGGIVDSGLEIHTPDVPVVPPVPGNLARLHPAPVRVCGRSGKLPDHVEISKLPGFRHYSDDPPREFLPGRRPGNVVFTALDHALEHMVAAHYGFFRISGINSLHSCTTLAMQEHAWIIIKV